MEERNRAQPEIAGPQTSGQKRMLRSTTHAQASSSSNTQLEQKKTRPIAIPEPRALLDREGLLKKDEQITAKSIYSALKLMYEKHSSRLPPDLQKTILSLVACIGILAADKGQEHSLTVESLAQKISERLENAVSAGMGKLSGLIEASLANQNRMQDTSKKMDESADAIQKALEVVSKNLSEVADTSNKLTTTVSSYKDALLAAPTAKPPAAQPRRDTKNTTPDPRITRDLDRRSRQILIDTSNKELTNSSLDELKNKFNRTIAESSEKPQANAEVQEVHKLRNGGIILQFNTKESAEWFKQPHIEFELLPKVDGTATVKERTYQILVPRVPIIFDPARPAYLREIEEENNINADSVQKARWIKPIYRRTIGQKSAHLTLSVINPETANILIRDGMYICGVRTYPKKLKAEPRQCMKCRRWGHFASDCKEVKDACGNCGEDHRTNECTDSNKRFCISCQTDTHASWDRNCPEFIRRSERMDENHPDNALMYFPTGDDWTLHTRPNKLSFDEKFPAKFAVASLPPTTQGIRQLPTRPIAGKNKSPKKQKRDGDQDILKSFLIAADIRPSSRTSRIIDEDQYDAISEDEANHLNTAQFIE